jgi:hypothetical protein
LPQNEVEYEDAVKLVGKGVSLVLEGANMPTTNDGINFLHSKGCVLAPAKACNAGAQRQLVCVLCACCDFMFCLCLLHSKGCVLAPASRGLQRRCVGWTQAQQQCGSTASTTGSEICLVA